MFSGCRLLLLPSRVIAASAQQGEAASGTRRKVKRQLSFQRYCHASRLLRGLVPHTPVLMHLLDDGYLGQAAVRRREGEGGGLLLRLKSERPCFSSTAHAVKSWHVEL